MSKSESSGPGLAALQLLQALQPLPSWRRFPDALKAWSEAQVHERFPVFELLPEDWQRKPPGPIEKTWAVYGQGDLATWWGPNSGPPIGSRVGGALGNRRPAVERVLLSPAKVLPAPSILEDLERTWRAVLYRNEQERPDVVVRNAWEERRAEVAHVRSVIEDLYEPALRAVRRASGDESVLEVLKGDPLLHDEIVDRAIAALQGALGAWSTGSRQELSQGKRTPAAPTPQLDNIEQAIALLLRDGGEPRSMRKYAADVGIPHSTLSRDDRWRKAWAVARAWASKDQGDLPPGTKDQDGNLDAEAPADLCENCRQAPAWKAVKVKGESYRLCEECARGRE